jgi:hypothetical protein
VKHCVQDALGIGAVEFSFKTDAAGSPPSRIASIITMYPRLDIEEVLRLLGPPNEQNTDPYVAIQGHFITPKTHPLGNTQQIYRESVGTLSITYAFTVGGNGRIIRFNFIERD